MDAVAPALSTRPLRPGVTGIGEVRDLRIRWIGHPARRGRVTVPAELALAQAHNLALRPADPTCWSRYGA